MSSNQSNIVSRHGVKSTSGGHEDDSCTRNLNNRSAPVVCTSDGSHKESKKQKTNSQFCKARRENVLERKPASSSRIKADGGNPNSVVDQGTRSACSGVKRTAENTDGGTYGYKLESIPSSSANQFRPKAEAKSSVTREEMRRVVKMEPSAMKKEYEDRISKGRHPIPLGNNNISIPFYGSSVWKNRVDRAVNEAIDRLEISERAYYEQISKQSPYHSSDSSVDSWIRIQASNKKPDGYYINLVCRSMRGYLENSKKLDNLLKGEKMLDLILSSIRVFCPNKFNNLFAITRHISLQPMPCSQLEEG